MLGLRAGQPHTKDHLLLYSPSANWGKNPAPRSGQMRGLAKATQVRLSKPGQRLPTAPPGALRGRGEAVSEVCALLGVGTPTLPLLLLLHSPGFGDSQAQPGMQASGRGPVP